MADLRFDPRADDFLTELEADLETNEILLGKLNSALDRLETNPGDAWCRRRRFQNIGVWGIAVTHEGREWLILWEQLNDDVVVIQAITPHYARPIVDSRPAPERGRSRAPTWETGTSVTATPSLP